MSKGTKLRSVRIPDEIWESAAAVAAERGETLSGIIRDAMTSYLRQHSVVRQALTGSVVDYLEEHPERVLSPAQQNALKVAATPGNYLPVHASTLKVLERFGLMSSLGKLTGKGQRVAAKLANQN